MTGTIRTRAILALPRAVFTLLGVTAVIVGILAMHVWMGGHGTIAAHGLHAVTGQMEPSHRTIASTGADTHASAPAKMHEAASPATTDIGELVSGCAEHCGNDNTALGLCVLALIVVTVVAFLFPAGRLIPGAIVLRGPPSIQLRPLAIPVPSLIRLCISRT